LSLLALQRKAVSIAEALAVGANRHLGRWVGRAAFGAGMKKLLSLLCIAFALAALFSFCALAIGCGGGGDDGDAKEVKEEHREEPPCKSIPIERRAAECWS
jgi:hypothetical protein